MSNMKTATLASLLALITPAASMAADMNNQAVSSGSKSYYHQSGSLDDQKSGQPQTKNDIKAYYMGTSTQNNLEPVLISRNQTAHGLIGEDIVNTQGQRIATVKDIILDRNGKAILVVVSDHGFLGIGSKVAAFDYSRVFTQNPDGNVVMGLSQDMVDRAADFSYDQKDWAKAKIIPNGSVSVNALLKGSVFDNNGKKVADVDNIYLRNSEAVQVIVSFNKTAGMGGDLAALNYDDLQKIQKNRDIDFKLTPKQSVQFANFKESAKY